MQLSKVWKRPPRRIRRCMYMAFVDLEEAYDNVNREKYGVKRKLLRAIQALYMWMVRQG